MKCANVADTSIDFALREGFTHIVFGQSARLRWDMPLRGSVINRFLNEVRDATRSSYRRIEFKLRRGFVFRFRHTQRFAQDSRAMLLIFESLADGFLRGSEGALQTAH